jgi:hypothetical protein
MQPGLSLRVASETKRILGQHAQLDAFFQMVDEALARGSMQAARIAFMRFRDAYESHVDVEEHSFFPTLRGLKPHLAPHLAQLVLEHARHREHLDELHELLARGSAEPFSSSFTRFCDELARHEAREEALIRRVSPD